MEKTYKVAGYVKLAKLWERSREQAYEFHNAYFEEKYKAESNMELVRVFVDITGNKYTYKRPKLVKLIRACREKEVDVISMQTRGYLAANTEEMCFLLKYLFSLPNRIDIVTEDEDLRIDTISNIESQRENLTAMAEKYTSMEFGRYLEWKDKLEEAMGIYF